MNQDESKEYLRMQLAVIAADAMHTKLTAELAETTESAVNNSRNLELSIQREEETAVRLAAATDACRDGADKFRRNPDVAQTYREILAILAAQPAAPRQDCDQAPCLGSPGPGCCPPAALPRTEAEQRVLDDLNEVPVPQLEWLRANAPIYVSNVAVSELARRQR